MDQGAGPGPGSLNLGSWKALPLLLFGVPVESSKKALFLAQAILLSTGSLLAQQGPDCSTAIPIAGVGAHYFDFYSNTGTPVSHPWMRSGDAGGVVRMDRE